MSEDDEFLDIGEAARRWVEQSLYGVERFPTGYDAFDLEFGMPQPGNLVDILARSSVGKSTFIANVIARTPQVPTVVFSQEMDAPLQAFFLACMTHELMVSCKDAPDTIAGADSPQRSELLEAMVNVKTLLPHVAFNWPTEMSVPTMRKYLASCFVAWDVRPRRVFVDHLGLMPGGENREDYGRNLQALKMWAHADDLVVYFVQQINRTGDGNGPNHGHIPPQLASGMMGGEEHIDMGIGLYQPALDPKYAQPGARNTPEYDAVRSITRVNVTKNRVNAFKDVVGHSLKFDYHSHRLTPVGEAPFILAKEAKP